MGIQITINSAEALFRINNVSGEGVSLSGISLAPGEVKTVGAWVFAQDKFRSDELTALIAAGKVQVQYSEGGYVYTLDEDDVRGMEAPLAQFVPPGFAATALPDPADVPVGYVAYDETNKTLVVNTGSAWA